MVTVFLCLLTLVLLGLALRLHCDMEWKWYVAFVAYMTSMAFTVNQFVCLTDFCRSSCLTSWLELASM